jgi:outer membrane protein assembly factor BamB
VGADALGTGVVSLRGIHAQGKALPGRGLRNTGNLRSVFHLYGCGVVCPAEPPAATDAFQRPLRSRFQARLSRSVRCPSQTNQSLQKGARDMRSRAQLLGVPAIIRMPLVGAILMFLAVVPSIGTAAPGDLLWENRGQPEPRGTALAIAVQGNVVVATGDVDPKRGELDWFVRAHDANTGVTLWEDRVGAPGFNRAQEVAVDAGRVFAAGWLFTPAHGFDFVVRAYDLNSGAFLWQQRVDRGGFNEFAEAVVAHDGRVFVAGRVLGATGSSDFALFAFDAQTGEPLWESVTDPSGLRLVDIAVALRAQGDRVFVAGTIFAVDPDSGEDFNLASNALLVRAHDARTGAVAWEEQVPDAMNWYTRSLAAQGDLLFVAGSMLKSPDNLDFMVRAYDAQTGALVWIDQVDQQVVESATALSATGDRLFVAGWDCDASFFNCHDLVRAYDAQTGAFLWQDRFNEPGGDVFGGIANPVLEADKGQVFLGGSVLNTEGRYEWTIRAYDAKTGTLGWEERIDPGGFFSSPNGFASQGDRLYAAGFIRKSDGTFDFTVRAYKTR